MGSGKERANAQERAASSKASEVSKIRRKEPHSPPSAGKKEFNTIFSLTAIRSNFIFSNQDHILV